MKFSKLATFALLAVMPLAAQQPAAQPVKQDEGQKIVAVVNGETITKAKLDALYERLGAQMRTQYESTGGKTAFLTNYVGKRLMLQEAIKTGFDKRPDVQLEVEAAKEGALFDRYIRDVVAAQYVTDAAVRKFYDENPAQFATPDRVRVRHIVIPPTETGPRPRTKAAAREQITAVFAELQPQRPKAGASTSEIQVFANRFAEAARKYSEDGVAQNGGDLGWVHKGIDLDPTFAEAMYSIPRGAMSGVVETKFGYHLVFIEDKQPAGVEPFEATKPSIREYLMNQHGADVMGTVNRLTNELRMNSKVAIYPENVK